MPRDRRAALHVEVAGDADLVERQHVGARDLELVRTVADLARDGPGGVDQGIGVDVNADAFDAGLRVGVAHQHLPAVRHALGAADLDAVVDLAEVPVGREERLVHRRGRPVVELERRVVRSARDAVAAVVRTRRQERVVRVGRVRRCLRIALAAVGDRHAQAQGREQLVVEAAGDFVGVGAQVVAVHRDGFGQHARDHRRTGLFAGLEVAIAVGVVPGVLLLVVGVRIDAIENAAARGDHVVVASGRELQGGAAAAGQVERSADARARRHPVNDVRLFVEGADQVREEGAGRAALRRQVAVQVFPANTRRHGQPLVGHAVLGVERRHVDPGLGVERRGKQRDVLRQAGGAVVSHVDVAKPARPVLDRGVRVVEPELEFVTAADEFVQVVLAGGIGLVAVTPPLGAGDVVARADAGGRVQQRLVVAVQVGREEDLVETDPRIEEELLRHHRVQQHLVDVEDVVFVAGRLLHERVGRGQEAIGLLVVLPRVQARQAVLVVDLVVHVDQARRDVGLVEHQRREGRRRVDVDAPVAERREHAQLPGDQGAAAADVDVRDEVDAVGLRAEAVAQQVVVDVLGLRRIPQPRAGEAAAPLLAAGLGHHVQEHAARRHGDVVRAS